MSSAHLADFVENAEYQIDLLIPACAGRELDARGIQVFCDSFRQRGLCSFFLDGDPRSFFVNAMQSAAAHLFYLGYAAESQKVTSRAKPLYDAIGCGLFDAASAIARRSRVTWNATKEYEDDFLFVSFLMEHCFLGTDEQKCRSIIDRHERVAEGRDEDHRSICMALLGRDPRLFDAALRRLLQTRAERVEELVAREAMPEEHWSWLRYFSSEGLALLRLAERAGIETGSDYLHVSDRLRRPSGLTFDPDAWKRLRYGGRSP